MHRIALASAVIAGVAPLALGGTPGVTLRYTANPPARPVLTESKNRCIAIRVLPAKTIAWLDDALCSTMACQPNWLVSPGSSLEKSYRHPPVRGFIALPL